MKTGIFLSIGGVGMCTFLGGGGKGNGRVVKGGGVEGREEAVFM